MAQQRLDDRSLSRPMLARRLAAQIGRNFSETISALIHFDDDVEAVARHFNGQDVDPEFEPVIICKSESEQNNSVMVDELMARGVLVPAAIRTPRGPRRIYASPGFARYLNAVEEEKR